MKALGLSNVHREKVMVPCWSRGDAAASFSAGGKPFESLAIAALGGSVPTKGELVAPVVEVASLDALEKLPAGALAGKIAFLSARTERRADGKGYGQAVGGRWRGPSAAAKKGAIAFMLRSVSTADDDAPHTGQMKYFDDAPKVAAVALGPKSADRLHEALGRGEVRVKLMSLTDHAPDAASANVVGEVPGSANPAEIVVLGAHLDSWDLGRGAQDDGAGVAVVLETAHRLVPRAGDPALRRTVRVVLYANEENGTRGASAYVEAHRDELARHVAAVECDEGAGSIAAIRWVGDPLDLPVIDGLSGAAAALGVARPTIGEHAGTDVSAMAAAGVPLLDLSQDALAYFDVHHAPTDVPASIDRAGLERAADQYTAFVRALAGDRTPLRRWKPPAEKH
jgi:carboxypeptidase Q